MQIPDLCLYSGHIQRCYVHGETIGSLPASQKICLRLLRHTSSVYLKGRKALQYAGKLHMVSPHLRTPPRNTMRSSMGLLVDPTFHAFMNLGKFGEQKSLWMPSTDCTVIKNKPREMQRTASLVHIFEQTVRLV